MNAKDLIEQVIGGKDPSDVIGKPINEVSAEITSAIVTSLMIIARTMKGKSEGAVLTMVKQTLSEEGFVSVELEAIKEFLDNLSET